MSLCACRDRIEKLRTLMELTYDMFESFTHPNVLAASQTLDDALVNYRSCPYFEICNCWGRETTEKADLQHLEKAL